jgi:hypothetical protein
MAAGAVSLHEPMSRLRIALGEGGQRENGQAGGQDRKTHQGPFHPNMVNEGLKLRPLSLR